MQKIPLSDLVGWMIAVHVAPTFFFFPAFQGPAGAAGWMAILIAIVWIAGGIWIAVRVWRATTPDWSLAEALTARLGPIVGGALNMLWAGFFLYQAALTLWTIEELLTTVALRRTPPAAIAIAMAIVVLIAVRQGVETIGRTVLLLISGGLVSVALMSILVLPDASLDALGPVFQVDWAPLAQAIISNAALADFIPILPFFLPFAATMRGRIGPLYAVPAVANGITAAAFILASAVLGFSLALELVFEFLSLIRYVSVGEIVQRLDALIVTGWIVLGFLRISAFFLAALFALRPVVRVADYRTLSIPAAIVMIMFSLFVFENTAHRAALVHGALVPFNLFFLYVLPAGILLMFRMTGRITRGGATRRPDAGSGRSRGAQAE